MGGMITVKLMVLHPKRVRSAVLGGMGWMQDGNLFPGLGQQNNSLNPIESCILGFKGLAVSAKDVRRIKVPFLVIIGGDDPLREKYVAPLHQLRPDVPVEIIEGAGHLSCVGRPEFKEEIKAFLETQSSELPLK